MNDASRWYERLSNSQPLDVTSLLRLIAMAKEHLANQPTLLDLPAPITICGDIHGQYSDLLTLMSLDIGMRLLFLGDFVDRGSQSVETISFLLVRMIRYPESTYLIRGNHESRQTTSVYGFQTECNKKYDGDPRAIVNNQLMAIHGGLSPAIHYLDQIRMINRVMEIPSDGPFADLVWSDPEPKTSGFHMSPRGAGFMFGGDIVEKFLHLNDLEHISRAHQLCMEGYQVLFRDTFSTIWSAPNYCYRFGNLASVMSVDENLERTFKIFQAKGATARPNLEMQPSSTDVVDAGYFT
ncbi:serine/threonine-protein phosphatase ppe1 [Thraustotheca clavata]|uniref:Serine/threonine-protein phosphatase n=1 Tax=Thraustotheca clavata TaxID=74557 RepID=A0A1V9YV52_9STRA|nr:serine/threonine-protein phosphatase ppe1 [Thraustotheca clavata]